MQFKFFDKKFPATYIFIYINLLSFILFGLINGLDSLVNPTTLQLYNYGAFTRLSVLELNEYYRIITSSFVHIGFIHLLLNMFMLYNIGRFCEMLLGTKSFIGLFFISILFGSVPDLMFGSNDIISAGASDAIYGLMASLLCFTLLRPYYFTPMFKQSIIRVLLFNFVLSILLPTVNMYAHLGGFFGGLLFTYIYLMLDKRDNVQY